MQTACVDRTCLRRVFAVWNPSITEFLGNWLSNIVTNKELNYLLL